MFSGVDPFLETVDFGDGPAGTVLHTCLRSTYDVYLEFDIVDLAAQRRCLKWS